ncbi:MAG: efflux RND transporter periplasmic adaptor subunit [Peptococcaceae bacterium]|nr:efflux RND transporter periplasmic adaptor subunit [Peptococcaceae bacterium]
MSEKDHESGRMEKDQENQEHTRHITPRVWGMALVAVVIVVAVIAVLYSRSGMIQPEAAEIKTGSVSRQSVAGDIKITGVLDTQDRAVVTPQIAGTLAELYVKEGAQVNKGDIVAVLDQRDLQIALDKAQSAAQSTQSTTEQARINYDSAQADYLRYQELFQTGAISRQQLDQAQAKRDLARSQYVAAGGAGADTAEQGVAAARSNLEKAALISPMDGVVVACGVVVGDNVSPSTSVVTIVSAENLVLSGNVPEGVINYLQVGDQAAVELDTQKGVSYAGAITFISPVSIPTGQFFPIKITMQEASEQLKAGMTVTAMIHIATSGYVAVPNSALFKREGRNFVYMVQDGKAVRTDVDISLQGDEYTAIMRGVTPGDVIVLAGTDQVIEGMEIPLEK